MLEALIEYAHRKQLVLEPGFAGRRIHWLINLDSKGQVQSVSFADESKRRAKLFPCCPDLQQPQLIRLPHVLKQLGILSTRAAHFLMDSCCRVVLYPDNDQLEQHKTFLNLIQLASQEVRILRPVAKMLSKQKEIGRVHQALIQLKATKTDKVSFSVDGVVILEDTTWHDWWRRFYITTSSKQNSDRMISLVSGEVISPARTHPALKSLVEKKVTFGAAVVAVHKTAFTSYGLKQAEHAAMSGASAAAYHAALEDLLRQTRMVHGTKAVYWYNQEIPLQSDPLALMLRDERIDNINYRKQLEDILSQARKDDSRDVACHIAVLRENENRVRISLYKTLRLSEVAAGLIKWLEDTSIDGLAGTGFVVDLPSEFAGMFRQRVGGKSDKALDFQPLLIVLYQQMLNPTLPIAMALVDYSLKSVITSFVKGKFQAAFATKADLPLRQNLVIYMGILKAFCRHSGDRDLLQQLNPNHPNSHYQTGRLTAMLERIDGLNNPPHVELKNQRLFLQIMTTPNNILQEKMASSQRKLKRLERTRRWFSLYLQKEMNTIWENLDAKVRSNSSVKRQCLFLLGYFQQTISQLIEPVQNDDFYNLESRTFKEQHETD